MTTRPYVRPTRALLHLGALKSNMASLRSLLPKDTRILGIVKANAYGHGTVLMAKTLQRLGAVGVGVADVSEALVLRDASYRGTIVCLGAISPDGLDEAVHRNLIVTLYSHDQLRIFEEAARRHRKLLRVHVKVDTGMHRLGLEPEEWVSTAQRLGAVRTLKVEGIFTHFSESDNPDAAFTRRQLYLYRRALGVFEGSLGRRLIRHTANIGAVLALPESHFDWVRPGIALYGYPPRVSAAEKLRFRPVLHWKAPILQIKRLVRGETVGYNRAFRATRDTTMATVASGYGDGFRRSFARAGVGFRGRRCKILGLVGMDLLMVDVSRFFDARPGQEVTLMDDGSDGAADAYELARADRTVPYEVLTGIHARVSRIVC
ncbi:MAG: alanine racemase [Pseudomonadota bacterium]